jgi:hypothetical protein
LSIVFIIGELLARWNQAVEIEYAAEEGSDRLLLLVIKVIVVVFFVTIGIQRYSQLGRVVVVHVYSDRFGVFAASSRHIQIRI